MSMMRSKLGLLLLNDGDQDLISDLEHMLQITETDMTIFFRNLTDISEDHEVVDSAAFLDPVIDAFYKPDEINGEIKKGMARLV